MSILEQDYARVSPRWWTPLAAPRDDHNR